MLLGGEFSLMGLLYDIVFSFIRVVYFFVFKVRVFVGCRIWSYILKGLLINLNVLLVIVGKD